MQSRRVDISVVGTNRSLNLRMKEQVIGMQITEIRLD